MDHDRPTHRRYNEKEIGALIQRATTLHEQATGASEQNRALTIEDIEHIAAEIGLPPEYVRTAALELEGDLHANRSFSLLGGPFIIDQARAVDGTMTEEQWEQVVLEIRRFTGKTGQISELGRAREWIYALGEGGDGFNFTKTQVTVRPRNGQTSIQLRRHFGGAAFAWYALVVVWTIGFGLTAASDGVGPEGIAVIGGMGLGWLAIVRASLSVWTRRQKARLKKMASFLHQTLSPAAPQVLTNEPATETNEPATERIELPEMDEPEQITTAARRGTRV